MRVILIRPSTLVPRRFACFCSMFFEGVSEGLIPLERLVMQVGKRSCLD